MEYMPFMDWIDLPSVVLRITILLSASIAATWLLRRVAAQARHVLWTVTFVVLLLLPLVMVTAPAWELPVAPQGLTPARMNAAVPESIEPMLVEPSPEGPVRVESLPAAGSSWMQRVLRLPEQSHRAIASLKTDIVPERSTAENAITHRWDVSVLLFAVWMSGCAAALLSLLVGRIRLNRLMRTAEPVLDSDWLDPLEALRTQMGIKREVELLMHRDATTPMTTGCRRPVIILPDIALLWSKERARVVLMHELVHVKRCDVLRHFVSRIALALYWFHPLAWIATHLAAVSREEACDEEVLWLGATPSDYARELLRLADGLFVEPSYASLPMIRTSQLEQRIKTILRPDRPNKSTVFNSLIAILLVAFGLTTAVANPTTVRTEDGRDMQEAAFASKGDEKHSIDPADRSSARTGRPAAGKESGPGELPGYRSSREELCDRGTHGVFNGSFDTDKGASGSRQEYSGWHNRDRVLQKFVEGIRICVRSHGEVVMADDRMSVRAVGAGSYVVLESEENRLHRLVITEDNRGLQYAWTVDGEAQAFDEEARAWMVQMFTIVEGYWEAAELRGRQSSLRGNIASHRGHIASLKGRIASHRGEVASMKGRIASHRGEVASMKGRIASQRGDVASLKGEIASLNGRIMSREARGDLSAEDRAEVEREIARIQTMIEEYNLDERIMKQEAEIDAYDLDEKVAQVEKAIEDFRLDEKVRAIEEEIGDYDLEQKIRDIEAEISELDADRRADVIESEAEEDVEALRRMVRAM